MNREFINLSKKRVIELIVDSLKKKEIYRMDIDLEKQTIEINW